MQGTVRPPAVAGSFYPREPRKLIAEVDAYLAAGGERLRHDGVETACPPLALVAPHAGYVYSGPIAGTAFATLVPHRGRLRRVVLLGPAHRVALRGIALPGADAFATPLGESAVDAELVAAVSPLPQVVVSPRAHAQEHALEVELPFLVRALGEGITILPLVVGDALATEVAEVVARVLALPEVLVVVSSDLSHYLPYRIAQQVDRATAELVLAGGTSLSPEQACGAHPWNGLLAIARESGLAARLLDLRNSGDTAGDRSAVVGYGAFLYPRPVAGSAAERSVTARGEGAAQ